VLIVRPVGFQDLQGLESLAVVSGGSMTTLPNNRDHLAELIAKTQRSLRASPEAPGDQSYHFVLEDCERGQIIGVAGIDACLGLDSPFYSYRRERIVHSSRELHITSEVPALHLCQDLEGLSRLCTFYIDPGHRSSAAIQLLSRSRVLFINSHRQRFGDKIIAELQGVMDENNQSPFWQNLGRHFFNMDYQRANYLTGINSKGFIADLMPKYPVYTPTLPAAAREVLGVVRQDQQAVADLLCFEGFSYSDYLDIFDAGPTLEAATDQLYSARHANIGYWESCPETEQSQIVSHGERGNFRALLAGTSQQPFALNPQQAQRLGVEPGAEISSIAVSDIDTPTALQGETL